MIGLSGELLSRVVVIPSAARNLLLRAERKFYIYILASKSRVIYVGFTGDLHSRVLQHKREEIDGFTKRYHVNRLVYFENFKYVNNAIARETRVKAWSRAKKVALIERVNPTWEDFAADWGKPLKMRKADSSLRSE